MAVIESKGDGYSLYNGVKLPSLPEWDEETYPYASIFNVSDGKSYYLFVSTMSWIMREGRLTSSADGSRCNTMLSSDSIAEGNTWVFSEPIEITAGNAYPTFFVPMWSNYDILNEDNTVHLAASEPISLDGMNVIEWDGDTEGLKRFGTSAYYLVSNIADINIEKTVTHVVRDTTNDNVLNIDIGYTPIDKDTYFQLGYSRYVAESSDTYPDCGVYFRGNMTQYVSLFAYYPIESSDSDGEKANVHFNNKDYSVDGSFLSTHSADLKSHLSSVMNGTGAVINLGGVAYNVDATKLAAAKSAFVQHLGTIAGSGHKVVIGGVEYGIDSGKLAGAVAEIEAVLGGAISGGDEGSEQLVAGLYQTGAIALYNEQGAEAIEGMMIKSWDELVDSGAIVINDGVMSIGMVIPDNLPEKNEYGFYFGVPYSGLAFNKDGLAFNEDGSANMYNGDEIKFSIPSGTFKYEVNSIDASAMGIGILQVFNDGLTLIGDNGFIVSIVASAQFGGDLFMPNDGSIISFADGVFYEQHSMTGIVISDSIKYIGDVFGECKSLENIIIPNSVESIDDNAFYYCENLIFNEYDNGLYLGNKTNPNIVFVRSENKLITSCIISNGTKFISADAFCDCENLTSVAIPSSVIKIGYAAFARCPNLTNITVEDGNAYFHVDGNCLIDTDNKMLIAGSDNSVIPIDGSVTTIADYAFAGRSSLSNITIPNNVTSIGASAFCNCKNLTSIVIPDSITYIDVSAFSRCEKLESITIPNSVTSIKNYTFEYCSSLTSVNIPDGVTSIGQSAFSGCSGLTSINIPDSVTSIVGYAFSGCSGLTSINIPDSVTSIGIYAFSICQKLSTINYIGTVEQWNAITKGDEWNAYVPATYVQCSDGQVAL